MKVREREREREGVECGTQKVERNDDESERAFRTEGEGAW